MRFNDDLLRNEMKKRGIRTLAQLAGEIDADEREVRRLVNDENLIIDQRHMLVVLVKIADYLGMKPFDLVRARASPRLSLEALFGSDVDESVLRQACTLDQLWYDTGTGGTPEIGLRWLTQDPNSIVAVTSADTDTVLGYVTSLPVSQATIDALMKGSVRDLDLGLNGEIEHVDHETLYIVSLLIDKRVAQHHQARRCLFGGFLASLRRRASDGHRVRRIVAEATEPHGPALCKRLKMDPIGESVRGTIFYDLDLASPKTPLGRQIARAANAG